MHTQIWYQNNFYPAKMPFQTKHPRNKLYAAYPKPRRQLFQVQTELHKIDCWLSMYALVEWSMWRSW